MQFTLLTLVFRCIALDVVQFTHLYEIWCRYSNALYTAWQFCVEQKVEPCLLSKSLRILSLTSVENFHALVTAVGLLFNLFLFAEYTGTGCQIKRDMCSSTNQMCENGATCRLSQNSFSCDCSDGEYGCKVREQIFAFRTPFENKTEWMCVAFHEHWRRDLKPQEILLRYLSKNWSSFGFAKIWYIVDAC